MSLKLFPQEYAIFFSQIQQYWRLTKPRVAQLAVFCAVVGMLLASPGLPNWTTVFFATLGIWLFASAAFAVNCLVEAKIDARMRRTLHRPLPSGKVSSRQTVIFSLLLGMLGMAILYRFVNPLTAWLTCATFMGYAGIYTLILKPATPQNIVIGGFFGAMPPALGWAAVTNTLSMEAWLLVLIIFAWTPPHFWALALYRREDYAHSGLPMLPITHGMKFTQYQVVLYTIILLATSVLPFAVGMSGLFYLVVALSLGAGFLYLTWRLYDAYTDALARKTFLYSIAYLLFLFFALLLDHVFHTAFTPTVFI